VREHVVRAFNGQGSWVRSAPDGRGEAGIDLLPGSDFLRRLNARPPATGTQHSIIAARWCDIEPTALNDMMSAARKLSDTDNAPQWLRDLVSEASEEKACGLISDAINGLGDGCVTLESAKLEGVDDFTIVAANHMTMIVNGSSSDEKVPPAIPLVLERLARPVP
jgi:hypothetical protein